MTNRLANETSPYLLQHAHNPVDWFPWGEEAFARARSEDRPVFLSIGYSACHWCHVMERESFENEEIAAILNERFVSIKVDREERPDIDSIYMEAVQLMTGHGGWPMSMFLTPAAVPFYGGTYFPPDDSRGMPGFKRVLIQLSDAYHERRQEVTDAGSEILSSLNGALRTPPSEHAVSGDALIAVAAKIAAGYDPVNGGFGGAPKFPPSMTLEFLAQIASSNADIGLREIVTTTLNKMARGGIYDQVGGGFHRYSVDARWLAPHFEKMLYDNALLARLYTHAWQWTKDPFYAGIANEILGFVSREMTSPEGAFYSTLDADSEGEEGRFYVWSRAEILEVLGAEEGRIFAALYDATEQGNWERKNILNVPREPRAVADDFGITLEVLMEIGARGKCKLYGRREERVRPGRDEKVLSGWNGWMLCAFAEAALAFDSESHRQAVRRNADFLIGTMLDGTRLYRSFKGGDRRISGLLEDYAGVAWGLIGAFEATQERRYLDTARLLAGEIISRFSDDERGGFFDTPVDHEKLITRPRDTFDNATPSGTSMAIDVLLKLALYFGDAGLQRVAAKAIDAYWPVAQRYPSGFGFFLSAANWSVSSPKELALTGDPADSGFQQLLRAAGSAYLPHRVLVTGSDSDLPLMEGRAGEAVVAYVCSGYACLEPTADP
ncbi:MAG: thioredoxin domain-containing protein, partial [Acidobacteriota bacterium]